MNTISESSTMLLAIATGVDLEGQSISKAEYPID